MAKASGKKSDTKPKSEKKPPTAPAKPGMDLGKELIKWSVVPILYQKKKGIIFSAATLAFAALVWSASSFVYALVAVVVSLGASASFALPTSYRLCEHGLEARSAGSSIVRKWLVFRNYHMVDDGVQLVYHPRGLRERASKGLFLFFGDVDRERVRAILEAHIEKP